MNIFFNYRTFITFSEYQRLRSLNHKYMVNSNSVFSPNGIITRNYGGLFRPASYAVLIGARQTLLLAQPQPFFINGVPKRTFVTGAYEVKNPSSLTMAHSGTGHIIKGKGFCQDPDCFKESCQSLCIPPLIEVDAAGNFTTNPIKPTNSRIKDIIKVSEQTYSGKPEPQYYISYKEEHKISQREGLIEHTEATRLIQQKVKDGTYENTFKDKHESEI